MQTSRRILSLLTGLAAAAAYLPSHAEAGAPLGPSAVIADPHRGSGSMAYMSGGPEDRVERTSDRTLAPYFHTGAPQGTDALPLKATSASVDILGVIAHVKVRQTYENHAQKPIEAVYVFPGSTRAAVHGLRMKIGDRTVEAKIDRRAQARQTYENARAQGQRASLLEQERPNVFTMNVANIMPNDRIEVELDYSELLVPEEGVYEFVYPTVVGPRYGGGADPGKDHWIQSPYLRQGSTEPYKFDLQTRLDTGIALKEITSPSHAIDVRYTAPSSAEVKLRQPGGGNRDYVLRYRLAGDQIETGLLTWRDQTGGYFALLVEPPARPKASDITPREYIFVLDVSGSMNGFPLETAKTLARNLVGRLRPSDLFNVILFSGASVVMSPHGSVAATADNIRKAIQVIDNQRGGGGTELMGALQAAYAVPRQSDKLSRSVIVMTDGYVGVEAPAFKFIRERLDQANLFSFGIGTSVNRALIEGMARAGAGEPFVVLRPEKATPEADRFRAYIEQPVLSHIDVRFNGLAVADVAPSKVPDLMARRPVVIFGKYNGELRGNVELKGFTGNGVRFSKIVAAQGQTSTAGHAALRWLWARKWVDLLTDEIHLGKSQALEDAVTQLGLEHRILTQFTSFVAVDSEIANRTGSSSRVAQPLPLPEGVSDLAVGGFAAQGVGSGGAGIRANRGVAKMKAEPSAAEAPMTAAPMPAAPPRMRTLENQVPSGGADRQADEKAGKKEQRPTEERSRDDSLVVLDAKDGELDQGASLRHAVESKLTSMLTSCGRPSGRIKLRLTIDRQGRVTGVEVLEGDRKVLACLTRTLRALKTQTRPTGSADTAHFELTFQFGR